MNNINNNNINKMENISLKNNEGNLSYSLEDNLEILKENMLKRCELEVPEYGDFKKVVEVIKNTDSDTYAGDISLICESSEKDPQKRYLSYNQMNPENRKGLNTMIASGNKEEILNILKDENLIEKLKENSEITSQKMQYLKW